MKNKISDKQLEAIPYILSSSNQKEAADKLGVDVRTIQRWKEQPEFQNKLEEAESLLYQENANKVMLLQSDAVKSLEDVMKNPDQDGASAKMRAAKEIISQSLSHLI
jgi:uncharacterized protein YjcR